MNYLCFELYCSLWSTCVIKIFTPKHNHLEWISIKWNVGTKYLLTFLNNQIQQICLFSQLLVLSLYNKKLRNILINKLRILKNLLKLVALNFQVGSTFSSFFYSEESFEFRNLQNVFIAQLPLIYQKISQFMTPLKSDGQSLPLAHEHKYESPIFIFTSLIWIVWHCWKCSVFRVEMRAGLTTIDI